MDDTIDRLLKEETREEEIYNQIRAATEFPGVQDVVITPDVHTGYVVPVGCVMATNGTLCQAPPHDPGRCGWSRPSRIDR